MAQALLLRVDADRRFLVPTLKSLLAIMCDDRPLVFFILCGKKTDADTKGVKQSARRRERERIVTICL
jgi:hypothetical protein